MENVTNNKKTTKETMNISTFLKEIKPVKNLQQELDKKNPLYTHPAYLRIMKERGHIK